MPYKSDAQRRWAHTPSGTKALGGPSAVAEWDRASKGKKLPYHAASGGLIQSALSNVRRYADGGDIGEEWTPPPEDLSGAANQVEAAPPPIPSPADKVQAAVRALSQRRLGQATLPALPDHPGEESLTAAPPPTTRQRLAQLIAGDKPSYYREQLAKGLLGTTGIGEQQSGLLDWTPAGQALGVQESLQHGEPTEAALWAMPGAKPLAGAAKAASKAITGSTAREIESLLHDYHTAQAHKPLDISKFNKTGGQKGSNPGGQYTDPNSGEQWYVKQPQSEDHANNEKLANELYKLAGVPVPEVRLTQLNGKPAIASKMIEGMPLNKMPPWDDGEYIFDQFKGLEEHFPADAWLGNYDSIGTGKDNIIIDSDLNAHRIDQGGALRYRAQGKPKVFGPGVPELQTMKDPNINPDAADVFHFGDRDLEKMSAQRIANIPHDKIYDLVQKYGPPKSSAKVELYHNLIMRKKNIEDHYGIGPEGGSSGPTGSISEELENLIAQQKTDEEEYWASIDKQAQHEYGLGQGIHDEDNYWQRRIAQHFKPFDWQSYKPPTPVKLSQADIPYASLDEIMKQGFNPEAPLFHGTHGKEVFDTLHDPRIHKGMEQAMFAADNPEVADAYANRFGDKGFIHKFLARPQKAAKIDWPTASGGLHSYDPEIMHQIINAARKEGHDLIVIHNIEDIGPTGPQTQYAILNPEILRYPHAKFDPQKLHLRYPLAGLVGGGLFAYGTLEGEGNGKMKRGGSVKQALRAAKKYAAGGGTDSWMMHQASRNLHQEGYIRSPVPGRTDKLPMSVPAGSHILPADIPSALGQGNSQAGGIILQKMFGAGPGGMPLPRIGGGRPIAPRLNMRPPRMPKGMFADGGDPAQEEDNGNVKIVAAGGEFVVHPSVVKALGAGDEKKGHDILDKFILHVRKKHIETLKHLKPPKK